MDFHTNSKIAGIGASIPSQRVTSEALMAEANSRRFGIPENFIARRVGIVERRFAQPNIKPSDLAFEASLEAISDAGLDPGHLDVIIFCGIDRDWKEPSTACRVQQLLGAVNASCFDISNACLGLMNGLATADAYIASGIAENVLVCTGEKQSTVTKIMMEQLIRTNDKRFFKNRLGALTVGDAGGALVIQRSCGVRGFGRFRFWTEGDKANLCYLKEENGEYDGEMLMGEISREITDFHTRKIQNTYSDIGWSPSDIELLYCHQVGGLPHRQMAKLAGIDLNRAPITYANYGNLTSATIAVNMAMNRPTSNHKYLILGTGSGLSICQVQMIC